MSIQKRSSSAAAVIVALLLAPMAVGQVLFSEDFETDPTDNWVMNGGPVEEPGTTNTDGDNRAFFFYDYSEVGIPPAPNSANGDTRGMKLQANIDANSDGISTSALVTGMSVSPVGLDLSASENYKLTFDLWYNFPGPFPAGSSGTSNLSTFGIGTSGTVANYPGIADGVWFAATGDGGSGADFRAYSQERQVSYQSPPDETVLDDQGNPIDSHATYHAGGRNNTEELYMTAFPGVEAPEAQLALFEQQTGTTADGAIGMAWQEVEIAKIGNIITWKMNDVLLITLDGTDFVSQPAGGNILFGHSDINAGASFDPLRFDLLFTLIDNVVVEVVDEEPGIPGDFSGNGSVENADLTLLLNNWGEEVPPAPEGWVGGPLTAPAVDNDELTALLNNWGAISPGGASLARGAVPEPGTWLLTAFALAALGSVRRRRAGG